MRLRAALLPVLSLSLLLLAWQAVVWLMAIPVYLLPAPLDIWRAGLEVSGHLPRHLYSTLITVLAGFGLSVLVAVPLGIAISINKLASEAFYPLLVFANAIPVIAVAPIIVVMFGTGFQSRLIINLLVSFFPIMVATATGILDTPRDYLDLSKASANSFLGELVSVRLPHAVPFIFSGLKIGIMLSVIGAVVGEFITSDSGLGYLILDSTTNFNLSRAMAAVIVLAVMSVILYRSIEWLQRAWLPWSINATSMR